MNTSVSLEIWYKGVLLDVIEYPHLPVQGTLFQISGTTYLAHLVYMVTTKDGTTSIAEVIKCE